ncbi:MAG TPA: hypothetical protein VHB70_18515 [Parafilimonas sp.]|nr:hypothetical protein [Parafilimonas sp.]
MEKEKVNIDFILMRKALKQTVREKAIKANSTIVYLQDGELIEEDPKTKTKRILKKEYRL